MADLDLRKVERIALEAGVPLHRSKYVLAARLRAGRVPEWRTPVTRDRCRSVSVLPDYEGPPCAFCGGGCGGTTQDTLELLAYLGHEGARELIGDSEEAFVPQGDEPWDRKGSEDCPGCGWFLVHKYDCPKITLRRFLRGLRRWRLDQVLMRAGAITAARRALPIWQKLEESSFLTASHAMKIPGGEARRLTLEAAEATLACPCEEHESKWWDAYQRAGGALGSLWLPGPRSAGEVEILEAGNLAGEGMVLEVVRECWLKGILE